MSGPLPGSGSRRANPIRQRGPGPVHCREGAGLAEDRRCFPAGDFPFRENGRRMAANAGGLSPTSFASVAAIDLLLHASKRAVSPPCSACPDQCGLRSQSESGPSPGRDAQHGPNPRANRDCLVLVRRRGYGYTSWPLEPDRPDGGPEARRQPGRKRPPLRAVEPGPARCRRSLLGL
jgi:hypothetical protein